MASKTLRVSLTTRLVLSAAAVMVLALGALSVADTAGVDNHPLLFAIVMTAIAVAADVVYTRLVRRQLEVTADGE